MKVGMRAEEKLRSDVIGSWLTCFEDHDSEHTSHALESSHLAIDMAKRAQIVEPCHCKANEGPGHQTRMRIAACNFAVRTYA